MTIYIGADHGAFEMKEILMEELKALNVEFEDCGCFNTNSVDYPNVAEATCKKVLENKSQGILLCGTGIGISIAANKVKGIRAALCHNEYTAEMAREHNNANVLCLGARVIGSELAKSIMKAYLRNNFEGGRHQRRLDLITNLENNG